MTVEKKLYRTISMIKKRVKDWVENRIH